MADTAVLVVNDDPGYLERVKQGIRARMGDVDVLNAISGPRAVGMAVSRPLLAVVIDADLAGVDAYELTQQLKAQAPMASVPVIVVAAVPSEQMALRARQVGAAAHLPKSVDVGPLVERIAGFAGIGAAANPMGAASPSAAAPEPPAAPPEPVLGLTNAATPNDASRPEYGVPGPSVSVPGPLGEVEESGLPHVDDLLRLMIERGASDLHLTVGSPPGLRLRGEIVPIEEYRALTPKDTQQMLLSLLSEEQRRKFETELELDFAYSLPGLSRFRANIFQQRNSMGAVFRVIPLRIPTLEELGLPKVCRFLADRPRGLVLVTGPTGSGKSTTLAAMVNHINETRKLHIITIEDPIEFLHQNKGCYVNQREVGEDTRSFADALKRVLRQDPDVILVGEMRDLETISTAITAAETGHLVFATLHTTGGPATVDRIIDVFPPHQQQQVRMQLSNTLEGVLSQVLLRSTDGKTRVMAMEVMLGIPAIRNLIREGKTHQMPTIIQGGAQLGMQTLDQNLRTMLNAGKITFEEAIGKAQSPKELAELMGRKM